MGAHQQYARRHAADRGPSRGPTHGAVLEIDQDLELWGVVRWKSLSEMFQETLESLETGRPVVTAIGREIRPETVRESDGTSSVVWT